MKKRIIIATLLILSMVVSACATAWEPPPPVERAPAPDAVEPSAPSFDLPPASWDTEDSMDWDLRWDGESYLTIIENHAVATDVETTLTFSLKVDTAAYTNVTRFIENGTLPPRDAVRTEELINFFTFENPMKFTNDTPFSIYTEVGPSPFNPNHHLAFVRVSTIDIDRSELPPSSLTFLIDTSGSMNTHDRMPLVKQSFALLVETLREDDIVSIVTYAGTSEVLLDGVSGADRDTILSAINSLEARGSTAGAKGIQTAYALAERNYIRGGNNRVILATDGDFNVGISTNEELARFIGEKRDTGVFLSVLGFGMGNIRDDLMETLAREGNGNYFYINNLRAAQKALVDELGANLFTIANDVKAQVEFNPANVRSFRLIGYENRRLANEDFDDDSVDAGEIGINTDIVIMFELELHGASTEGYRRYAANNEERLEPANPEAEFANELFDVRIRYMNPGENVSNLISHQVFFDNITTSPSTDFRFATAVAAFSHLLRGSENIGNLTLNDIFSLAEDGLGNDFEGYRRDFLRLLDMYRRLAV